MFNTATLNNIQTGAGLTGLGTGIFSWQGVYTIILPFVYGIAGIILLINIVTAGFKIMTSMGDPKAMQAAQAKLTTSLIGVVILFVSFWIVQLIWQFLGIEVKIFT